jgi:hypothetical protein
MSSKWGGSCTSTNTSDPISRDSSNTVSCPVYTSPSGVSVSGTGTVASQGGDFGGGMGVSVNIPFP